MGSNRRSVKGLCERIAERDNHICHICKQNVKKDERSVDHIVPRAFGGTNADSNLKLAHSRCNSNRGDGLTESMRIKLMEDQWNKQGQKCSWCHTHVAYGNAVKIPADHRKKVSWENFTVGHMKCKKQHTQALVVPWNSSAKKFRGDCIKKILGV